MRKLGILAAVLTALVVMTSATFAASPHVVGPLSTTSGPGSNQVTISGKIAGLGNGFTGTPLTGTADATFDVQCANPQGKLAPGQQGVSDSLEGSGAVDGVDSNGNYTFHITFTINLTPAKAWGCPNNQWTASAINLDLTLTSLTLQGGIQVRV
jgi:hypothetical protein